MMATIQLLFWLYNRHGISHALHQSSMEWLKNQEWLKHQEWLLHCCVDT